MKATAKALLGRTIVAVNFRPFKAGRAGKPRGVAHDPVLTLDNGRRIYFIVEETEVGEYGISIQITDRRRRRAEP